MRNTTSSWRQMVADNLTTSPPLASLPFGLDEDRVELLCLEHSCDLGLNMHWPYVPYQTNNLCLGSGNSIRLRVTLHVGIPAQLGVSWSSVIPLNAIFPLFGTLRSHWGSAIRIFGQIRIIGESTTSGHRPLALQAHSTLRAEVLAPTENRLRCSSISIRVTTLRGSRMDVLLRGASLQVIGIDREGQGVIPSQGTVESFIDILTRGRSRLVARGEGQPDSSNLGPVLTELYRSGPIIWADHIDDIDVPAVMNRSRYPRSVDQGSRRRRRSNQDPIEALSSTSSNPRSRRCYGNRRRDDSPRRET